LSTLVGDISDNSPSLKRERLLDAKKCHLIQSWSATIKEERLSLSYYWCPPWPSFGSNWLCEGIWKAFGLLKKSPNVIMKIREHHSQVIDCLFDINSLIGFIKDFWSNYFQQIVTNCLCWLEILLKIPPHW